jgi:hypothetical protein
LFNLTAGGLGNTAFVGFLYDGNMYGKEGLKKTTPLLSINQELCRTFHFRILVATYYSRGTASASMILKKILFLRL